MIEIGDMVIRVPFMSEEQAMEIGNGVAERLAANLPVLNVTGNRQVNELNIQVSWQEGWSNTEIEDMVTKQLLLQLKSK